MEIRALVFDLAGVLLDFGGPESIAELSNERVGEEAFFRFWSESMCAHDFHLGKCTPEHFAWQAVRELGLSVTPDRFLAEFRTWLHGPYPGAFELLEGLRPMYRVACLSNTNILDVRRFDEELKLQNRFDQCFYSNEIGVRKPDPHAYLHVSQALDLPPGQIAFFDDSLKCVNGAIAVGMHAYHCVGFSELRRCLSKLGILDGRAQLPYWSLG